MRNYQDWVRRTTVQCEWTRAPSDLPPIVVVCRMGKTEVLVEANDA